MKTPTVSRFLAIALIMSCAIAASINARAKDHGYKQPQLMAKWTAVPLSDKDIAADSLANTPDAWNNIKDYPYEKRKEFTAVLTRLVNKLDSDIRDLNAKRETMTNDTKDWDFAMKELNSARSDLQSKISDLSRATTPETWDDAKEKLGIAWDRSLVAVKNVKASTTS